MDPTLNSLAYKEILEMAAKDRSGIPLRPMLLLLGNLLVTIGQMMRANRPGTQDGTASDNCGYPSLENEACL